jgi:hypothetical protein
MKEWFEEKTIAVVGNAASLIQQNYGKEIDQAEVVVRINRGGYRFVEFSKQMGTRNDVWCMQNVRQNKAFFDKPHTRGVRKMQMDTIDVSPQFAEMADLVFSQEDRDDLDSNLTKKSSTGLRVLYYISKQNPLKVSVYGFDWKKSYSWHERRKCVAHIFDEEKDYCFNHFFNADKFVLRGYN